MTKVLKRQETLVNPLTGETVNVVAFIPEIEDSGFTKVFDLLSEKVFNDLKIFSGPAAVLFYILRNLRYNDNKVYLHPDTISEHINKTPRMVRIYINQLQKLGYIHKTKQPYIYAVEPKYAFRGRVHKFYQFNKNELNNIQYSDDNPDATPQSEQHR